MKNKVKSFHIKFIKNNESQTSKITVNNNFSINYIPVDEKEGLLNIDCETGRYNENIKILPILDGQGKTYKSFLTITKKVKELVENEKVKLPIDIKSKLYLTSKLLKINIAKSISSRQVDIFFVDEVLIKNGLIILLSSTDRLNENQSFKIDYAEFDIKTESFFFQTINEFIDISYEKSFNKLFEEIPKTKEIYLEFL